MFKVEDANFSAAELEKAFLENPKLAHEQLRLWKETARGDFLRQSTVFLETAATNSFTQVLTQLCREDSRDLQQLQFAADILNLEESARLLRVVGRNDPSFQMNLISSVRTAIEKAATGAPNPDLARMLDILSKSMDREKLAMLLASMIEHPDERLRSKVALLCGPLGRGYAKRIESLKDKDPRVRANAVEALWGRKDPESIQLLREASRDPHHRVAANAYYGLYLGGDVSAIRGILKLARETDLPRQLAGIWLLGQTGDPRFLPIIQENLAVKTGRTKFSLLNAGRKIKKRMDDLRMKPQLEPDILHFERADNGRVRCVFQLRRSNGVLLGPEELMGTQVLVQDNDLKVDQYLFEARGGEASMHAVFFVPLRTGVDNAFAQSLVSSMEKAIATKREADFWAVTKYMLHAGGIEPFQANFVGDKSTLETEQLRAVKGAAESFARGIDKLVRTYPSDSVRRHLVAIVDPECDPGAAPEELSALLEQHRVMLSIVCCRELEPALETGWRQACFGSKGLFIAVASYKDLEGLMGRLTKALLMNFYLTYQLGRAMPVPKGTERTVIEFIPEAGFCHLEIGPDGRPEAGQGPDL